MQFFLEILADIIFACMPWPGRNDDRSMVGQSDFDRHARLIKRILITLLILVAIGISVWLYWKK